MGSMEITELLMLSGGSGLKKILKRIGMLLRGWLPLFKLHVQERMEEIIQQVEREASLAPQIKWIGFVRVGSIRCSAFGGLQHCDLKSM